MTRHLPKNVELERELRYKEIDQICIRIYMYIYDNMKSGEYM